MAAPRPPLEFDSENNEILLNPRWPKADFTSLQELALSAQEHNGLRGHVWLATSGSTADSVGTTKLVALSKKALLNSAAAVNEHLKVTSKDVWTQVLPHFHVGGLGIEVRAFVSGSRVIPALRDGKWEPKHFYKLLSEQGCTLSALVPAQVYDLVRSGFRGPTSLRAIVVGGGALEVDLFKKARSMGWPVLPSYGMTETASQIATASLESLSSSEFPVLGLLNHAEAQISDEGFIKIKATSLFTSYAQNSAEGAKYWDPKQHGWFTTEDQGEVKERALVIGGRSKDYLKIGGEATNIARLRSILDQTALQFNSSWPLKVTLIDSPSERLGTEIHLVSLLTPEDTQKLQAAYEKKVLPFEKARQVHFVKELPRSDLGKILWAELRKQL